MATAPFTPSKVICSAGINPWLGISCTLDFREKHYFRHGRTATANLCIFTGVPWRRIAGTGDSPSRFRSPGIKLQGIKQKYLAGGHYPKRSATSRPGLYGNRTKVFVHVHHDQDPTRPIVKSNNFYGHRLLLQAADKIFRRQTAKDISAGADDVYGNFKAPAPLRIDDGCAAKSSPAHQVTSEI
jgi:hypothetical protein